jgi:hypothetical protein
MRAPAASGALLSTGPKEGKDAPYAKGRRLAVQPRQPRELIFRRVAVGTPRSAEMTVPSNEGMEADERHLRSVDRATRRSSPC